MAKSSIVYLKATVIDDCWICGVSGLHQYYDRSVGQVYCNGCVGAASKLDRELYAMYGSHPKPEIKFDRGWFQDE